MKLHSPVPHRKARIEIIPLIDIMFFLLASFMLVSMSMIKLAGVKMTLPQAATAQPEKKPDFIPISVSALGDIFWDKDQKAIAKEDITAKVKAQFQTNPDLRIYINADTDARHGAVIEVLDKVRQAGVTKVSFAIKPGGAPAPGAVVPAPEPPPVPVAPKNP